MCTQDISGLDKGELVGHLDQVRSIMVDSLRTTSLRSSVNDIKPLLGGGKMLRARLAVHVGMAAKIPLDVLLRCAAAVEMIHAASLLHDDIIDEAPLRRNLPTFWIRKGVSAAILLGDFFVCRAIALIDETMDGKFAHALVKLTGEMCEAEVEQELLLKNVTPRWEKCVSIARRKTGALFAFIGYFCGDRDFEMREALVEAGYLTGTAYQLADDILDVYGESCLVDKTLGRDAEQSKITAVSAWFDADVDPVDYIKNICEESISILSAWPVVQYAWREYMEHDIGPAINKCVEFRERKMVSCKGQETLELLRA